MNVKHCTREQLHTMGSGLRVVSNEGGGGFFKEEGGSGWCLVVGESMGRARGFSLFNWCRCWRITYFYHCISKKKLLLITIRYLPKVFASSFRNTWSHSSRCYSFLFCHALVPNAQSPWTTNTRWTLPRVRQNSLLCLIKSKSFRKGACTLLLQNIHKAS